MSHRVLVAMYWLFLAVFGTVSSNAQNAKPDRTSMPSDKAEAISIISEFAERTGLTSDVDPQRYLWTDAFALYNFLELYRQTGDDRYRALASDLIEEVQGILGRHRPDDPRTGWLSGLPEEEERLHPTRGGLRIGKPLPERPAGEPIDERLEWDRDGQYFHYLTKWMDALSRAAIILDEPRYHVHAVELAEAVFPRFLQLAPSGIPVGLAWKMSIDLSRPQVSGMSPHDALDGYVTFRRLSHDGERTSAKDLEQEIGILRELSADHNWATADPLGIGGLLLDAFRLAILPDRTLFDEQLIRDVLAGADVGLQQFLSRSSMHLPASQRLAFRELGLAIGLQALPAIAAAADRSPNLAQAVSPHLESLLANADVGRQLVEFWSDPSRQDHSTWRDHRDINEVMLATALLRAQVGTAPMRDAPASQ